MRKDDINKKIVDIFKGSLSELEDKELDFSQKQNDFVGWDSFAHMELVGKIEQVFNITLELDDVIEIDSPQAFVDIVVKKTT